MNAPVDDSPLALFVLLASVVNLALYVWTALALSAMFRKMGEEPWKGWVPFLNLATVLRWGGFSPWLVLLLVVPVANIAVLVVLIVAVHRINPGFGYGSGMTVLAVFLFVVWASILGFGPARWLGARNAGRAAPSRDRRSAEPGSGDADAAPPPEASMPIARLLPPESASSAASGSNEESAAPEDSDSAWADGASFAPPAQGTGGWTPPDTSPRPGSAASPGAPRSAAPAAAAPPRAAGPAAADSPAPPPSAGSVAPPPGVPAPVRASTPPATDPDAADDAWPSEVDDVSAIHPSPFPPSSAAGRPFVSAPVGAESGPIAFVPGRRTHRDEVPPSAPVTRVPAARPVDADAAVAARPDAEDAAAASFAGPARARRAYEPDPDGFPEMSGEVSAVVGAPIAGRPRSAAGAVSAQQHRAESPEGETRAGRAGRLAPEEPIAPDSEDIDQTIMTRRAARPTWELVPASGAPIALTAAVVILGRRPAGDPAFPAAQLVAVAGDARTVSKTHARIEQRGEAWIVTDLGSTNGVLVRTLMGDEVEVEPGEQLDAGERFFLGDEEFHLRRLAP